MRERALALGLRVDFLTLSVNEEVGEEPVRGGLPCSPTGVDGCTQQGCLFQGGGEEEGPKSVSSKPSTFGSGSQTIVWFF